MKKWQLSVIMLAALAIMLIPAIFVSADDDMAEFEGVYVQDATGGSFVDNGDDTYTLTLEGVAEDTPWMILSPKLSAGTDLTMTLSLGWAAMEDLSTSAVLESGDYAYVLTLNNPVYNMENLQMQYTATVDEIYAYVTSKDEPAAPESFEAATLFITLDAAFNEALIEGFTLSTTGTRTGSGSTPVAPKPPG